MACYSGSMDEILSAYVQVIDILDGKVEDFRQEFGAHMQCRKGCSSCCEDARFKVRYVEAMHFLAGFDALSDDRRTQVVANLKQQDAQKPNACPALVDGACVMYEHRPSLCRAYGILIELREKVITCPLNFKTVTEGEPLKKLDLLPFYDVLDDLSARLWQRHFDVETTATPSVTLRELLQNSVLEQPQPAS